VGYCCTCGLYCEGGNFQAGHYEPSGSCGALLRYHPQNMHGQGGYCCNLNRNHQQKMGNDYTFFMINKYGQPHVEYLESLKNAGCKYSEFELQVLIDEYKTKLKNISVNY